MPTSLEFELLIIEFETKYVVPKTSNLRELTVVRDLASPTGAD